MTEPIHAAAAHGFTAGVDAYERARPSYPPDAVQAIVDCPCRPQARAASGRARAPGCVLRDDEVRAGMPVRLERAVPAA
jgi:hypothetical protein